MNHSEKPNILFMLADDLGWGDVSYHGSDIRTPNIDRLVEKGAELDRHYVCPMCTPTRACFITGRHPGRFGRHATTPSNAPVLPEGYETIATSMRRAGYATGLFGKWHLGSRPEWGPNHFGFDYSYGSLAGGVDPYMHRYKEGEFTYTWHRNGKRVDELGHVSDLIVDEAIQWIESRTQPWFCYVPFTAVHTPIKAPQHWIDSYASRMYDHDLSRDRSFKVYAAYASHMDYNIGRLMECLERLCSRDNTIVVFTSDNGAIPADPLHDTDKYPGRHDEMPRCGSNLPLRGQKSQLYEGGIRTPAVISWTGKLEPRKLHEPLHMVDWMPTFANLVGIQPENDPRWDGTDIWPLLSGQTDSLGDRHLFWNFGGRKFGARKNGWKLITDADMNPDNCELFQLDDDPYETMEMSAKAPEKVAELRDIIIEERKKDDVSKRPDVE